MHIFDRLIVVIFSCTALIFSLPIHATLSFWTAENTNCKVLRSTSGIYTRHTEKIRWYGQCLHGMAYGMGVIEYLGDKERFQKELLASYKGQMRHGSAHGKGEFLISYGDGAFYKGQLRNNKYHGQGRLALYNREIYVGQFQNHRYHGHGYLDHYNGTKYKGEFRNGVYHGDGTFSNPSLSYTGRFRDGDFHGQFTITGGITYAGQVLDGKPNGQKIPTPPNGFKYEKFIGEYRDDKPHGLGAFILPNGEKHIGPWDERCVSRHRFDGDPECPSLIKAN